jgi:hypothetical protein
MSVTNVVGTALPKSVAEIPLFNGQKNYNSGSLVPAGGSTYASGIAASTDSLIALAPYFDNDILRVRITSAVPNKNFTWRLKGTVGLASYAPAGTKTKMRIFVEGNPATDINPSRVLLMEAELIAGAAYPVDFSLLPWVSRSGFAIEMQFEKVGPNNYNQGVVLDNFRFVPVASAPLLSIDRSNLAWETIEVQNKVINTLATIPAKSYRDNIRHSNIATTTATLFKRAQDQGKQILVLIMPDPEDYVNPSASTAHAGSAFAARCGWSTGQVKLSEIDLARFESRLRKNLSALKSAGVNVVAFEIGNELDWVCFNGDLPFDRSVPDSELAPHASAYARFLERAVGVIRLPQYYPTAKIVGQGVANPIGMLGAGAMENPGKMLALLKNQDGKDDLALIDIIGVHIYPNPYNIGANTTEMQAFLTTIGSTKPVWVTEWGFPTTALPTTNGLTRTQAFFNSFKALVGVQNLNIENLFTYALDSFGNALTMVDAQYNLLPEASYFKNGF